MAVVVGYQANLTEWLTPNNFVTSLHGVQSMTIEETAASMDVTRFRAAGSTGPYPGVHECLNGVRTWGGSIRGQSIEPATNVGHLGLVAGSSMYVTNAFSWSLGIECIPLDVTAFQPSSDFMAFQPGKMSWGGSYTCWLDGTQVPTLPTLYNAALTPTFTLSGSSTMSGSAFINSITTGAVVDDKQAVTFGFMGTGDLTVVGSTGVITATATTKIAPGSVGYTATQMTFTAVSGRTYIGTAFWTRVGVSVTVGQKTEFDVSFQGTGALTKA